MRALTVRPGLAGSAALTELADPEERPGVLIARTLLTGVCGTDREIVDGTYGATVPGDDQLIIGHEAVARLVQVPSSVDMRVGDLVVPIVRRPDPVPCPACAAGEWDMCQNDRFTEHGIRGAHGFACERFEADASAVVAVPAALGDLAVLVEPASVVAKAWEQIERIGRRAHWNPRTVLITGAGPVGLLAALMAHQRGLATHVLDRVTAGPKPGLVADLDATYHTSSVSEAGPRPDIVIECTGAGTLVLDAIEHTARNGIVCLTGLSSGARTIDIDTAALNRRLVLENDLVFGTVNANRRHYEQAVAALAAGDAAWLARLITRRVLLDDWPHALTHQPDDVKVVLDLDPRTSEETT